MIPALAAVILAATAFSLGWFLCSRTQRNRLEAAATVREIMAESCRIATRYQEQISERSDRDAGLAQAIAVAGSTVAETKLSNEALAKTIDALDRTVGQMLKALVLTGVVRTTAGPAPPARDRMVGEDHDIPLGATADMR